MDAVAARQIFITRANRDWIWFMGPRWVTGVFCCLGECRWTGTPHHLYCSGLTSWGFLTFATLSIVETKYLENLQNFSLDIFFLVWTNLMLNLLIQGYHMLLRFWHFVCLWNCFKYLQKYASHHFSYILHIKLLALCKFGKKIFWKFVTKVSFNGLAALPI